MSLEQALLRYSPFWFVYHFFDKVIGKKVFVDLLMETN